MIEHVRALDEALRDAGEWIILRRGVGTGSTAVYIDVRCRASVRRDAAAIEIVGTLAQGEDAVIISPTEITAAQWPGGQSVSPAVHQADPRVPLVNDTLIIQGRVRKVKQVKPVLVDGELVRIEMVAAG